VVRLPEQSDAEVVRASLDDPALFEALFERHVRAIYGYLARRVGPDAAKDLAADVFTLAFARRDVFGYEHDDARPWLFGIATNLVRNHRRSEVRRLRAFARSGIDPLSPDRTVEADDRLDAERSGPALARALAELRPDDRDVLLLFAWSGLTYQEIAAAIDVPIGTVRSRLARARRTIRELLRASGQLIDETDEGVER
jgi:RNA polymerase sigma-70 factor (ECF subfamily)